MIVEQYCQYQFLLDQEGLVNEREREFFTAVSRDMDDDLAAVSLHMLSRLLMRYYNKKTNPYLERAIMTGITRVSKESIFSDLNNLSVVTATSDKYADAFGFTQEEVSAALHEFGLSGMEEYVRDWYDGFTFGNKTGIYNPWSIISFLSEKKLCCYWADTSSNALVSKLVREGSRNIKTAMEELLAGGVQSAQVLMNRLYSASLMRVKVLYGVFCLQEGI